jgi:hypothetical protein
MTPAGSRHFRRPVASAHQEKADATTSTTLVYDLQYRLRCRHCRPVSLRDERDRGNNSKNHIERVIVRGGE